MPHHGITIRNSLMNSRRSATYISTRSQSSLLNQAAVLALCLGALCMMAYALVQGSLAVVMAYLLFGIMGLAMVWRGGRAAVDLFSLAYGVVCFFSVLLYVLYIQRYGLPYFIGGSDDLMYDQNAILVAKHFFVYDAPSIGILIQEPYHNSIGYIYLVSLLVRFGEYFGGYDTMLPRIFNASMLGLTAVMVFRIARQIRLDKRLAVIAGLWVILFPMMFYSAAHVFRDTMVVLLLMCALYFALAISTAEGKVFKLRWLFFTLPFLLLIPVIMEFRLLYVIPIVLMPLSAWAFKVLPVMRFRLWHALFLLPVIAVAYFMLQDWEIIFRAVLQVDSYADSLAAGSRSSEDGLSMKLFSLPEPMQTVARLGYAVITPLPIIYSDIELNILSVGTLVQVYFSSFVILGIKKMIRDVKMMPLLLGFGIVFYSYFMGTFTFRHITQWFPFAVLIGMVGYARYKAYRKEIFFCATVLLVFAAFFYVVLKNF